MSAGKKLAKLNPKNVRFDAGIGGGTPDLISTDFAAAVAFMPKGLGRELLCRMWWPAGSEMDDAKLLAEIKGAQIAEWKRREEAMLDAMLVVAIHGGKAGEKTFATAHARRWPKLTKRVIDQETSIERSEEDRRYSGICTAVFDEFMHADACPTCRGHCEFEDDNGVTFECMDCLGSGKKAKTDNWRAVRSGVRDHIFLRDGWDRVYTWLLGFVRDTLDAAERRYDELTAQ